PGRLRYSQAPQARARCPVWASQAAGRPAAFACNAGFSGSERATPCNWCRARTGGSCATRRAAFPVPGPPPALSLPPDAGHSEAELPRGGERRSRIRTCDLRAWSTRARKEPESTRPQESIFLVLVQRPSTPPDIFLPVIFLPIIVVKARRSRFHPSLP